METASLLLVLHPNLMISVNTYRIVAILNFKGESKNRDVYDVCIDFSSSSIVGNVIEYVFRWITPLSKRNKTI